MHLLIAEDDAAAAHLLERATREAGYEVTVVADGVEAAAMAASGVYDLVLLDIGLPGLDGLSICRELRVSGSTTPILLLTARDTLDDVVRGLDAGADDYLVKPFRLAELTARVRALLRRGTSGGTIVQVGDLCLDPDARTVVRAGEPLSLSATEYRLLEYLMCNAGRVLSRAQLLEHVWGYNFHGTDGNLDVYLSYLRSKIDRGRPEPLLRTVRGFGYTLRA